MHVVDTALVVPIHVCSVADIPPAGEQAQLRESQLDLELCVGNIYCDDAKSGVAVGQYTHACVDNLAAAGRPTANWWGRRAVANCERI